MVQTLKLRIHAKFPEFKSAVERLNPSDPRVRRFNAFFGIFHDDTLSKRFEVELRATTPGREDLLRLPGNGTKETGNVDLLTPELLKTLRAISVEISGYGSSATYYFRETTGPFHQSIIECSGCRFSLAHQWSGRLRQLPFATVMFYNERLGDAASQIIRPALDRNEGYADLVGDSPKVAEAVREVGKWNIAKALILLHPYFKKYGTSEEFEDAVLRIAFFLDQISLKHSVDTIAGFALLIARMGSEYRAQLRDVLTDRNLFELARTDLKPISRYIGALIETIPIDELDFFGISFEPRNTLNERFEKVMGGIRDYAQWNGLLEEGGNNNQVLGFPIGIKPDQ